MSDIVETIEECNRYARNKGDLLSIKGFLYPHNIVTFAAYLKSNQIKKENVKIICTKADISSYLDTVGFNKVVWGEEIHNHRHSHGKNYSPLVLLENEESVDESTNYINSCILHLAESDKNGAQDLCEIVGELTDNVWSHGEAMGFSMAQKYAGNINFALADCGKGFYQELKSANIPNINNHIDALEWCIKPGNSSKKVKQENEDSFLQRLPPDCIGNPMPGIAKYKSDNNHEGFGLAKLINLLTKYKGEINIISGDAKLVVSSLKGDFPQQEISSIAPNFWKGVIINCGIDPRPLRRGNLDSEIELNNVLKNIVCNAK